VPPLTIEPSVPRMLAIFSMPQALVRYTVDSEVVAAIFFVRRRIKT